MKAIKRLIPRQLRSWYWDIRSARLRARIQYARDLSTFGKGAAHCLRSSNYAIRQLTSVTLPGYEFPLYFRPRTSDVAVIRQVFGRREYGAVSELPGIRSIVDCGANIGCTAFFLLHAYPLARIIVVEPDSNNMAICRRNLKPFGNRVTFVQSGVWSTSAPLRVVRGEFRDGQPWSYQVRPCSNSDTCDFSGITLQDLTHRAGDRIDLLKIDIEGAEIEVFSTVNAAVLDHIGNIAIELHDEQCENVFRRALSSYVLNESREGELTICKNIVPRLGMEQSIRV